MIDPATVRRSAHDGTRRLSFAAVVALRLLPIGNLSFPGDRENAAPGLKRRGVPRHYQIYASILRFVKRREKRRGRFLPLRGFWGRRGRRRLIVVPDPDVEMRLLV